MRRIRYMSGAAAAGAAALGISLAACGSPAHHTTAPPANNSPANNAPSSQAPAAPSSPPPPQDVTFETSGSAPSGVISPTITYGPDGSSASGQVPMDVTQTIPNTPPDFYFLDLQLSDAGGSATCTILIDGHAVSTASASGADNIADCQVGYLNGQWVNENTGG